MIRLKQYRDPWMAEGFNDYIGFYTREYYVLDNFSSFKVEYEGETYATVEEAYQAQKFIDRPDIQVQITKAMSAHEAKKIAHDYDEYKRSDWEEIKLEVMEKLLRAKLEQHPYVAKKLLETEGYDLVEDSPTDTFWGCGEIRTGENHLGRLWMKLRTELRENENCKHGEFKKKNDTAVIDKVTTEPVPEMSVTPDSFYNAWWFLIKHKMFQGKFLESLDIELAKVDPVTLMVEDERKRNTLVQVWLETGPYENNELTHDMELDCGGNTFEEAICKLAELVKKHYGIEEYPPLSRILKSII